MRLGAKQTGRVREHRRRVGLGEPDAGQGLEEDLGVLAGHVRVGLALGRRVAEVAEAIDDLLRRAAADPELEATACDQVGGSGIFDHVQRVFVAHVDDGRADLDAPGSGADRSQEREWRRQLLGEMVDPEVGAVGAQVLDRLGKLDRLDQRIGRRAHLRVGRGRPVPEGEESDLLHPRILRTTAVAADRVQGRRAAIPVRLPRQRGQAQPRSWRPGRRRKRCPARP